MDTMSDVYSYESHTHNLHSLNEDNSSQILTTTDAEVYTDIQTSQGILGGFKYFATHLVSMILIQSILLRV